MSQSVRYEVRKNDRFNEPRRTCDLQPWLSVLLGIFLMAIIIALNIVYFSNNSL